MFEQIRLMREEVVALENDHHWGEADRVREQVAILQEHIEKCNLLWADCLQMASDPVQAAQMVSMLDRYTEPDQRVSRLASGLYAKKLITPGQFLSVTTRLSAPTPTEMKMNAEMKRDREHLERIYNRVLDAVDPGKRGEALAAYNTLSGGRSERKLKDWVSILCERDILPRQSAVALRFDDWLSRLFPGLEQKVVTPGENK